MTYLCFLRSISAKSNERASSPPWSVQIDPPSSWPQQSRNVSIMSSGGSLILVRKIFIYQGFINNQWIQWLTIPQGHPVRCLIWLLVVQRQGSHESKVHIELQTYVCSPLGLFRSRLLLDPSLYIPIKEPEWVVVETRWNPSDIAGHEVQLILTWGLKTKHPQFEFCETIEWNWTVLYVLPSCWRHINDCHMDRRHISLHWVTINGEDIHQAIIQPVFILQDHRHGE